MGSLNLPPSMLRDASLTDGAAAMLLNLHNSATTNDAPGTASKTDGLGVFADEPPLNETGDSADEEDIRHDGGAGSDDWSSTDGDSQSGYSSAGGASGMWGPFGSPAGYYSGGRGGVGASDAGNGFTIGSPALPGPHPRFGGGAGLGTTGSGSVPVGLALGDDLDGSATGEVDQDQAVGWRPPAGLDSDSMGGSGAGAGALPKHMRGLGAGGGAGSGSGSVRSAGAASGRWARDSGRGSPSGMGGGDWVGSDRGSPDSGVLSNRPGSGQGSASASGSPPVSGEMG